MSFWGAYQSFWRNYFNFSGRATRTEYWFVFLWNVIIGVVLGIGVGVSSVAMFASAVGYGDGVSASLVFMILFGGLLGIYTLAALIPSISLAVRRFRDAGVSPWWFFGFYVANLILNFWLTGGIWTIISFCISIATFVITVLPTKES